MMLIPNTGKVETMMGNNAQCIAQAIDVAIPKASQLSLIFIVNLDTKVRIFALMLQIIARWFNLKSAIVNLKPLRVVNCRK